MSEIVSILLIDKKKSVFNQDRRHVISARGEVMKLDERSKISLRCGNLYIPHHFFDVIQMCDNPLYEKIKQINDIEG